MNKLQRAIVYPYNIEFTPVLRHRNLIEDYEIVSVIAPNGWGLTNKDASCLDGGKNIGIKVNNNFNKALEDCDTVIFIESDKSVNFDELIRPKIYKTIESKKNIVCTLNLEETVYKEIKNKCDEANVNFKYFGFKLNYDSNKNHKVCLEEEYIFDMEVPVIFVLGMLEKTQKFEVQLSLREEFIKMGYKVSQIGTKNYCETLGFKSFPEFMFNSNICESNKVVLFNHYVKNIEIEDKPDVIIIGIPGAIMPYNNQITNKFGILAYEISNAIKPDASVFCTYYEQYDKENLNTLSNALRYKLGVNIDCFNIAPYHINVDQFDKNKCNYLTLDYKFIDNITNKLKFDIPIFNISNGDDGYKMSSFLVEKLSQYGEVQEL